MSAAGGAADVELQRYVDMGQQGALPAADSMQQLKAVHAAVQPRLCMQLQSSANDIIANLGKALESQKGAELEVLTRVLLNVHGMVMCAAWATVGSMDMMQQGDMQDACDTLGHMQGRLMQASALLLRCVSVVQGRCRCHSGPATHGAGAGGSCGAQWDAGLQRSVQPCRGHGCS